MFENINFYQNLQYQLDPSDQIYENDQKPHFWLFGSVINEFLSFLNDHSWSVNLVKCWRTFSSITICNIKWIQLTKHMKMAKSLIFGFSDHSKMHFYGFWMILYDLATLPNVGENLVLSKFAIWSRLDGLKSRKWPKTSFMAIWILQKSVFEVFELSFMTWQPCRTLKNIQFYQNLQYQVDWTDQSQKNGQKPHFLQFGSFKNDFSWFLNDPSCWIWLPNC